MPTKSPNQGLPVYAKNEAGWDMPAHAIQLHGVYPCEVLNLRSDPESLKIARNTLYYYEVSQKGFTETMNELGLSAFVMGARMGFDAGILVENMKELIKTAGSNFLINDGNHCTEKAAIVETVNSMMLQSVDGILYLFPCWTQSPASFTRLRAKGAFIVSADYDGHTASHVTITSEQGGTCRIYHPLKSGKVKVKVGGKVMGAHIVNHVCSFKTEKGKTYQIDTWK